MERIAIRLTSALKFIQPYIPLIDSHMVNFFTANLWETLVPLRLKEEFNDFTDNVVDIFSCAASGDEKYKELSRFLQAVTDMNIAEEESLSVSQAKEILELGNNDFKRPPLGEFMSKKKSHEVEVLVEFVAALTHYTGVTHVVEVGDGKGYSSSLLALQHGIKVLGLESSEGIIHGAEKRKTKLYKYWKSCKKGSIPDFSFTDSPHRQAQTQVSFNTNIGRCVQHMFPEDWPLYSIGITGLHTCGDLSPICFKLFLSNDSSPLPRFLINVGCCYHLLNTSKEHCEENPTGFPLSSMMKQRNFKFSRNARMMSLQAPPKMFHLQKLPAESLMYRAVLEQLLDDIFGTGNQIERDVGRIGVKCENFVEYVRKASIILNCHIPMDDDELRNYYKYFEPFEKKLHFYFMLRVVMAPVIEAIILLDRLLFLREKLSLSRGHRKILFSKTV
ncbi:probable methyltransferase-like protein 25 isoform X2 [Rhodnius prolixus]|uniref:probable methyltransferase-like protein 25 isoform X2 n=1 Tax=Rhodnius prolixus TaxID=13249 RepID=UPI003D18AF0B